MESVPTGDRQGRLGFRDESTRPIRVHNPAPSLRQIFGRRSRTTIIVAGDAAITIGAHIASRWLVHDVQGLADIVRLIPWSGDFFAGVLATISTVALLLLYRGYRELHRPYVELVRDVLTAVIWSVLLTMAGSYLYVPARGVSRAALLWGGIITTIGLLMWRVQWARQAKQTYHQHSVTLISTEPDRWQLCLPSYVRIHESITPAEFKQRPVASDRLMLTPDVPVNDREWIVNWALCNQVDLYIVPNTYEILLSSGRATQLSDVPVLLVYRLAFPLEVRAIKRLMDLVGATLLFVVFLPVFLLAPLAIWLEDRGPVFYHQVRVGRDGKPFKLIKFRSMVPDAERLTGPVWARADDPRVTKVGKFLRATRLDEVPQILNVLKGEMSLVGPRPERPELASQFAERYPMFRAREAVKPGITGLAQVLGRYDTEPDLKLYFDLLYITRWSVALDLMILFWTVPVVLFPQLLGRALRVFASRLRSQVQLDYR